MQMGKRSLRMKGRLQNTAWIINWVDADANEVWDLQDILQPGLIEVQYILPGCFSTIQKKCRLYYLYVPLNDATDNHIVSRE